jgi:ankyrin repeat protein
MMVLITGSAAMAQIPDEFKKALAEGDTRLLAALLDANDGRMIRGPRDENLLFWACTYIHSENRAALVTLLLERGFPANSMDNKGLTPLHWAAGSGCVECIPLLLAAGADVNARRNDGGTPLHTAALKTVDMLLDAGADTKSLDKLNRSPLHTTDAAHPALLVAGVNARDVHGLTPLHYAALHANIDWVNWLLVNGADPAIESTTPFHYNGDQPDGAFGVTKQLFETGTRAYDIARWGYRMTRWSTGQYRGVMEELDAVTPRRGWFSR